jgi:hypothetical protein
MLNFSAILTPAGLANLGQIIIGDLTMAGDNVVIMGSLASGLPEKDRKKVLLFGVGMALVFLIGFALLATQLLKITGWSSPAACCCCGSPTICPGAAPKKSTIATTIPTRPVEGPPRTKTFCRRRSRS